MYLTIYLTTLGKNNYVFILINNSENTSVSKYKLSGVKDTGGE